MAKIVYACVRDLAYAGLVQERIESVLLKLVPDNIPDAKCKVVVKGQIIYGISTYSSTLMENEDGSVCMGMAYKGKNKWWKPGSPPPEGSYAIFRADDECVEAITDIGCSRATWYYKDEMVFIAGTSQRAIINVAGKFNFDSRNLAWMLSSGTLAPSHSWCKNVHFLGADGSVLLNRKTWELTTKVLRPEFPIANISDKEFYRSFKNLLLESFTNLQVDLSNWILPISGGYDSRGIACFLKETGQDISRLDSITWGIRASETNKKSDGYLGGATARGLGMPHTFWPTDDVKETAEKVFERFILCSEGRTDHIGGYADGMAIWKSIFYSGKHGILRGDETFGGPESGSFLRGRLLTGCKLCTDFSNLENYQQYGLEKQLLPEHLKVIQDYDTPGLYRDRLYQEFRMPFTLSALSDIKYAYTELLNPFLSRSLILFSRTLPDHLRSNKLLCTKIIDEISPKIPYATEQATDYNEHILKTPDAVDLFRKELCTSYIKALFPKELLDRALSQLDKPAVPVNRGLKSKLKALMNRNLPVPVRDRLRSNLPKPALDAGMLAFRIYITGKMYKMLTEDIRNLKSQPSGQQ